MQNNVLLDICSVLKNIHTSSSTITICLDFNVLLFLFFYFQGSPVGYYRVTPKPIPTVGADYYAASCATTDHREQNQANLI